MATVSKSRPKRTRRPAVKAKASAPKASAPKAAPLAHVQPPARPKTPEWYEQPGVALRVLNDEPANHIQAIVEYGGCDVVLGTVALVYDDADESVANRIIADPSLLDTHDLRYVTDTRGICENHWPGFRVTERDGVLTVNYPPAEPATPTEPSPEPLPNGQQRYYPELDEWSYPIDSTRENVSGVFRIRNEIGTRGSGRIPGEIVATVTVSPEFNQEEANSIVTLMASAPDLWRKLRERSRFDELDPTGMEEMNDIHATLWQAARRNPFGRRENSEDEILYRRQMNQWAKDHGRPEPFKEETPAWAK